jgi:hypothetical protein
MKTPREVLLNRHRSIEPKLDTIRQKMLNNRVGAESMILESEVPATAVLPVCLSLLRRSALTLPGWP